MLGQASDTVLTALVAYARKYPSVERIVLFGSRARGDARPRSDYDFAISAPSMRPLERAALVTNWSERKPTLLATDIVWLDEASAALLQCISTEGVEVYAR